jgi:thiol:disulfide interchange protein DsbG
MAQKDVFAAQGSTLAGPAERRSAMDNVIRNLVALAAVWSLVAGSAGAADTVHPSEFRKPDSGTLYARLEKADAVQEGARPAKSVLYVFFDANCYYCHLTWKALQPYEKAGLQVRWVPVAYQQPSSAGRAAAIMEAPDRVAALRENETTYDPAHFAGGIPPAQRVPAALAARLRDDALLMQAFGAPGTPALVWKDRDGRVRLQLGVPHLSELPRITGLPAQPVDDPELARFR